MSNVVSANTLESVLAMGDLSKLSAEQRVSYIHRVCESVGLNPLTRPFEYQTFQGKLVLYARKDATEQLRKLHKVSVTDIKKETIGDLLHMTVFGHDGSGKSDLATGVVSIAGLKGVDLANAYLKCETKAKRRFTLSICGLGILDESEIEDMRSAAPIVDARAKQIEARLAEEIELEPEFGPEPSFDPEPAEPAAAQSVGDYLIQVGTNKGKRLRELPRKTIENFVRWALEQEKLAGGTQEYLEKAQAFLEESGD